MFYKYFFCFVCFLAPLLSFSLENDSNNWYRSGANNESTKSSPYSQINKKNVSNLELAWHFHSGIFSQVETNPIFTGASIISAFDNYLYAINPKSGMEIWKTAFETKIAKRGLTYFNGYLYVPSNDGTYEVEVNTGKITRKFGKDTSYLPPVLTEKSLIVANYTSVQKWNLKDGKKVWETLLIKDNVNTRIWSGLSYDKKSKIIYVVTSNSGYLEDSDIKDGGYSCSILAINSLTGKIIWQFQDVKHDIWDLDVVGAPVIIDIEIEKIKVPAVVAVTKSGNILFLNRLNGKPIFPISSIRVAGPNAENPYVSREQLSIKIPEPFSSTYFDINSSVTQISKEKNAYVLFKLRNVRNGKFLPFSSDYDVAMFGLHGGAEWPGAALSYDGKILIVPSNKYPWIFRKTFFDLDEGEAFRFSSQNKTYMNKCAVCHGGDFRGAKLLETEGDYYFPSLIGISHKRTDEYLSSIDQFNKDHEYIVNSSLVNQSQFYKILSKVNLKPNGSSFFYKVKFKLNELVYEIKKSNNIFLKNIAFSINNKLHIVKSTDFDNSNSLKENLAIDDYKKIINSVTQNDLIELNKLFSRVDKEVWEKHHEASETFWQLILDQDGLPGSNPPWGTITASNLINGKTIWNIPFGYAADTNHHKKYEGDMNFGGVMTTASSIFFASGTRDAYARSYNVLDGKKIWEAKMPAAGSAPPMSYFYNGCQYIVFTATGNKFFGYDQRSDSLLAYKLRECKN
jgi:glucose dehydrogenase